MQLTLPCEQQSCPAPMQPDPACIKHPFFIPTSYTVQRCKVSPADCVAQRFADANAAGMNIMRFFNGGEGMQVAALQTSPGATSNTLTF